MYYFYFDCGTSNTRGYLIQNSTVISSQNLNIGSKDVSICNDKSLLVRGLKTIYDSLLHKAGLTDHDISCIYASGMITSPYGLVEVPHAAIPIDKQGIKASIFIHFEHTLFHREIHLIRGLKTTSMDLSWDVIEEINNLRGEEVEIAGICNHLPIQWKSSKYIILLPGSHTHAVLMDKETILDIFSLFSGEIFHALTSATVLASSTEVQEGKLQSIDLNAVKKGCEYVQKYGFARAVYIIHAMKIFNIEDNYKRRSCLSGVVTSTVMQSFLKHLKSKWEQTNNIAVYAEESIANTYLEVLRYLTWNTGLETIALARNKMNCCVEGFVDIINS
ncbi:2-dehydro-3-deoxygalactonokinase [Sinanaerobacter chloroacetimidivorans]|uniref:2-dehydro-3-deoxygalactonokinase n=1 Tax=Sinanaerobacter chloroacetimidivorans TaxID=2818044 RepID=A0A8J7W2E0_9FIRM|nr:2-dehydro-3-deoxygalactonokinase [Sinanaerobacter chloroacetimidivorans]MBR0597871.1 2-dehydro-3-deoxygalactonokinase [Sinanaerobacter chloroacetimidivorans]